MNRIIPISSKIVLTLILAGCADQPVEPVVTPQPMVRTIPSQPITPQEFQHTQPFSQSDTGYYSTPSQHYYANSLSGTYASYPDLHRFIQHMVDKHGFSEAYLNGLFSTARRLESVIKLESPAPYSGPTKPKRGSWTRYREKFLTEKHIQEGVAFWQDNAHAVDRASATYHVDPEYIIAIIGVETYFGKNIGKTCIFDALTTLAFDTHRRSKFFTSELENYLLMTREQEYEPREPVGSWAGAMGLGQFMPSSYRRLAVDFDNNGRSDIWNPTDAIGSVAHYFSRSGWRYHNPVAKRSAAVEDSSVIELSTYEGMEYWYVHPNFKVIKKYNNSDKYAMAVHQLAQAIKQRYFN